MPSPRWCLTAEADARELRTFALVSSDNSALQSTAMAAPGILRRNWMWLAAGYAVFAVPPLLMDSERGAALDWTAAYLLFPIMLVGAIVGYPLLDPKWRREHRLGGMLTLAAISGVLFLAVAPMVSTLNAILPPQSHLLVEGTVVEKRELRHRGAAYILRLNTPDGMVDLEVSADEFRTTRESQVFQQERRIGPMGITYRWIWERKALRDERPQSGFSSRTQRSRAGTFGFE